MEQLVIIDRKKGENNREYSYRLLRYNIMNMYLVPGTTLNEGDICKELNVSRTPVHEAMTLLRTEQLVDIVPQCGSSVSLISLKNVREGSFMRNLIEPTIYKQIAKSISPAYLNKMQECINKHKELLAQGPLTKDTTPLLIALDDEFHHLAYEAAQKPNLWKATRSVCSHYDRIRFNGIIAGVDDPVHVLEEHTKILEYLLLGGNVYFDFDEEYKKHLNHFTAYFSTLFSNHPEFFTMGDEEPQII